MRAHGPTVPYLEPIVGAAWWTIGAAALDAGTGTVVLAAGLGLTGVLVMTLRRRHGGGAPLPSRGRFLRLLGITVALVAVAGTALGPLGWGELAVPVMAAVVGVALLMLSAQLDARSLLALGGAVMVLGAAGALLALGTAGRLYPQGVVGLVAGALFWLTGAHRTGLLAEVRERSDR